MPDQQDWYCVRTVLRFRGSRISTYEERLTLWAVPDFAGAIEAADAYLFTFFDTGAERQGNIFSGNAGVPLSNGGANG